MTCDKEKSLEIGKTHPYIADAGHHIRRDKCGVVQHWLILHTGKNDTTFPLVWTFFRGGTIFNNKRRLVGGRGQLGGISDGQCRVCKSLFEASGIVVWKVSLSFEFENY